MKVLPPDINESGALFKVMDDKTIRFGLIGHQECREGAVESIVEARKSGRGIRFFGGSMPAH